MQDKRDQLQAYRYQVGRMVGALVRGEPEALDRPMRRSNTGAVIGTILAVLVAAGFGVYGVIRKGGNNSWREPGTIIVEEESGARYLYLDGTLRPTLNYASARLAAGGEQAGVRLVSRNSLAGVPHGRPIGIPDAPDALPQPSALSQGPWTVCTSARPQPNGTSARAVVVTADADLPVAPVPDDHAVLVETETGERFLVWHDQRMRVVAEGSLTGLGFAGVRALPVRSAWLNTMRGGPDLSATAPDGVGSPGPPVGGAARTVGQVLRSASVAGHYLVRRDGLAPIGDTEAALWLADARAAGAYQGIAVQPITVPAHDLAQAPRVPAGAPRFPAGVLVPEASPVDGLRALCAEVAFDPDRGPTSRLVTVDPAIVHLGPGDPAKGGAADRVALRPGSGMVLAGQAGPGVDTGARYLLTDLGMKYPLPSDDVAAGLGYSGVRPVAVPTTLLDLLPSGPVLDPARARAEA